VQQLAAQLPWGHHMVLLDRLKDQPTREWYVKAAVEHGWSCNLLVHHISTQLQERQGKALTNFSRTLPPEDFSLNRQGEGTGAGFAHSPARPPPGVGSRLRFRRQSGAVGGG
jgi:uncharacterized protein DUF1016